MGLASLHVDDETNAAGVALVLRVVEALCVHTWNPEDCWEGPAGRRRDPPGKSNGITLLPSTDIEVKYNHSIQYMSKTDGSRERWMGLALEQARRAGEVGEVPVGAVVVIDDKVVGSGFNQPIRAGDPTAHAEIVAIRDAARALGNYRLTGATLVVTIEPCLMCVGASVHARIATVVFGASEPRTGALVSTVRGAELPGHNHRCEVVGGVCEDECRALMQAFFRDRR